MTVDLESIRRAAAVLDGVAARTPVLKSTALDRICRRRLFLKAEHRQRAGSFKFRGAYAALSVLSRQWRQGVCTVSSGNFAQALALAGSELAIPVTVHMPSDAPALKRNAAERYGAEVVDFDRLTDPQHDVTARLKSATHQVYVSPHDNEEVISAAGTLAVELLEDAGVLDTIVMPVGAGGGLAGVGVAARELSAEIRILGAEPAASGVNHRSLRAGRRVTIQVPRTIADGQTLTTPGELTFPIMSKVVDDVLLVSDAEIIAAMHVLHELTGEVVEPSGASGLAAVLGGRVAGRRIGVVLTGGNVDPQLITALRPGDVG